MTSLKQIGNGSSQQQMQYSSREYQFDDTDLDLASQPGVNPTFLDTLHNIISQRVLLYW